MKLPFVVWAVLAALGLMIVVQRSISESPPKIIRRLSLVGGVTLALPSVYLSFSYLSFSVQSAEWHARVHKSWLAGAADLFRFDKTWWFLGVSVAGSFLSGWLLVREAARLWDTLVKHRRSGHRDQETT